jgi:bifunctional DNase/RNase
MMIPVVVESVRMNLTNGQRVVILKDGKLDRYLLVWVGQAESMAIALELQSEKAPRPLTADLLRTVIEQLGAKVKAVHVTELSDGIFYARLVLQNEKGEEVEIDSRPSDAIALAVRTNSPIFVDEDILDKESIKMPANEASSEDDKLDVYRDFVNSLFERGFDIEEGERRPDA